MSILGLDGIYQTLLAQLEKLRKHNRQGSIKTKERYYQAMQRFCRYLANVWRLQKLLNIDYKHIEGYTEYLKKNNKSASTIKTDLAAIRFFHDKMSEPRHKLPSNFSLELSRRRFIGFDRTWSAREFDLMLGIATKALREDYVCAMCLAYYAGLRIHECCRIDTATAEKAVKTKILDVKGKNGKTRTVPIDDLVIGVLKKRLNVVERGEKLLVPSGTPTHIYIKQLQHFISHHRNKLPPRHEMMEKLTFHGLRHSFAYNKYDELTENGMKPRVAKQLLSKLLGHERGDVTEIYLSGYRTKEADDE